MHWWLIGGLSALSVIAMGLERRGVPLALSLGFRGDIKRETAFLAQYGQTTCTVLCCLLIWRFDPQRPRIIVAVAVAFVVTGLLGLIAKRLFGRVRPNREHAGRFLGPSFKRANYRESFPSSHSATAMALSTVLAAAYPQAAGIFWVLAIVTAALRYVLEAHWPSDVVVGVLLGYVVSHYTLLFIGLT
jgi:membrane-associated phospholipid phosphatase